MCAGEGLWGVSGLSSSSADREGALDLTALPNIVLVHGAWADGSSWSAVIKHLQVDGYHVAAPQFPESSLAADVKRLRGVLARQDGPTLVAGHSYGGKIITALGTDTPIRRFRPMLSGSSPLGWARRPWRSRPTTWPWCPTQRMCCSSSRRPSMHCRPQAERSTL
jgi:pimeloyl-ACP methyl ester carboxylesterase